MFRLLLLSFVGTCFAIHPVGRNYPAAPAAPDVCNSCREVVGFVRRLLDTNEISEVKANLTNWCLEESASPRDVCSLYVEDGIDVLRRVGVDSFCERLDACPIINAENLKAVSLYAGNASCDFCINVVTHVKEIVASTQTEQELEKKLQNACNHCPARDECISVLDKNVDCLFDFLRNKLNPREVCKSIGYCSLQGVATNPVPRPKPTLTDLIGLLPVETGVQVPFTRIEPAREVEKEEENGNPMNCIICRQIASWAIKKLKDNRTEQAIVQALDEVCDRIFSKGKQTECEAFVKTYTDELISIFKETDDPKLICILLGVCDKNMAETSAPGTSESEVANCNLCLDGSRWILDHTAEGNSEAALSSVVKNVCTSGAVPESDRYSCDNFVRNNEENIRTVLQNSRNPNVICRQLALCRREWTDSTERENDELRSLPSCFVCREIAKWVNRQVKQNRTEESIEAALRTACRVLKNVENCEAKVTDWSSRLITVLKTASDPQIACELLQVCGSPDNQIENEERITETTTPACYECQTITHFIQEELYSFDKEKRIEDYVIRRVCEKIGNDVVRDTCESFINQYGPSILQMIAAKAFDSKTVCEKELKICTKTPPRTLIGDIEITSQNTCRLCQQSVRELDVVLASGEVEREISHLGAKVCDTFSPADRKQCMTLVEAFGPYFLQMVGRMSNPLQVCKELDLCSEPGEVQLLGGHKCSYGPAYWCHTIAHASSCKAEEYCRRVWQPVE